MEKQRNKLKDFISYKEGEQIRMELHKHAVHNYIRRYSDLVYRIFMNTHPCKFDINHPQSSNHPYYFTLFTIISQHVMGDCIEECLDKAIDIQLRKEGA